MHASRSFCDCPSLLHRRRSDSDCPETAGANAAVDRAHLRESTNVGSSAIGSEPTRLDLYLAHRARVPLAYPLPAARV
eukprot:3546709-Prymnesium_polylepis.1